MMELSPFCCVLLGLVLLDRPVLGVEYQFTSFTHFVCPGNIPVCATSQPSNSFGVQSKAQCVFECQRQQPKSCVGVNFREPRNTCDIFYDGVTDYTMSVVGCQYMQSGVISNYVRSIACAYNVALKKPTWQSSQYNNGVSSRAVDGITDTNYFGSNSCSETTSDGNPWWAVDLGSVYFVNKVTLFNRADCCETWTNNFNVDLTNNSPALLPPISGTTPCGQWPGVTTPGPLTVNCSAGLPAFRYVVIRIPITNHLTICELQVFPRDFTTPG